MLYTKASALGYAAGLELRAARRVEARERVADAGGAGPVAVSWFAGPGTDAEGHHESTADVYARMSGPDKRAVLLALVSSVSVQAGRGKIEERCMIEFVDGGRIEAHTPEPVEVVDLGELHRDWRGAAPVGKLVAEYVAPE